MYAPTSGCDKDKVEELDMDLEKFQVYSHGREVSGYRTHIAFGYPSIAVITWRINCICDRWLGYRSPGQPSSLPS
ncbi:hypothetical protein ANCDUO_06474 [Ancylostoma duodenale]|uniref:Uncharacterized protein n=1 Tax=Ancylostoma duodenale TaxID=51022 RepID=A0A0C2H1D2_9BILA|nr:hypothetical protein ANCDUO_06474 [Ancylostoma duodenale]